jgi:hypothetical protein
MSLQESAIATLDGTGRDPREIDRLVVAINLIPSTPHTLVTAGPVNHDPYAWW